LKDKSLGSLWLLYAGLLRNRRSPPTGRHPVFPTTGK
jgi:hypothetical protein